MCVDVSIFKSVSPCVAGFAMLLQCEQHHRRATFYFLFICFQWFQWGESRLPVPNRSCLSEPVTLSAQTESHSLVVLLLSQQRQGSMSEQNFQNKSIVFELVSIHKAQERGNASNITQL